MGSSPSIDKFLQVHITLNKGFYHAGQLVQGVIHINCLSNRPYRFLAFLVEGQQQIRWSQKHGKSTYHYRNSRNSYNFKVVLSKFEDGIHQGQYSFPFSLILPSTLPSSFTLDNLNFIHYYITALFPANGPDTTDQFYRKLLHVRQPPRIPMLLKGSSNSQSFCCGCCCQGGSVNLSMQASVQFIQNTNQTFTLRGTINNEIGQMSIQNYKIVLTQSILKVSDGNRTRSYSNQIVLYDARKSVPKGFTENFSCEVRLPAQFRGYTAIGNIISRTYYLTLVAQACCCFSNPSLLIHTIVNSDFLPLPQPGEEVQAPLGWNPIIYEIQNFTNLPPYIYQPSQFITVHNQAGFVPNNMMTQMMPIIENSPIMP